MNWEEIILSALRKREDLHNALKEAARKAPRELSSLLKDFPDNIQEIEPKLHTYPRIISLVYYHFLAEKAFHTSLSNLEGDNLNTSIHAALKVSSLSRELGEKALEAHYLEMAGNGFYRLNEFSKAEKLLTKALGNYRDLARESPEKYENDILTILNDLGSIYLKKREFLKAENVFSESIEICSRLERKNLNYAYYSAFILQNMGILYFNTKKFSESEKFYKKALEKYKIIEKIYPQIYSLYTAQVLRNLGILYWETKELFKAERAFSESLRRIKNVAQENPVHQLDVAATLKNLGILYRSLVRFAEAENALKEALDIYQQASEQNPQGYTPYVASTLCNLGNLYWDTGNLTEAERTFEKALEIFKNLEQKDPAYLHDSAGAFTALGNIYNETEQFSKAEKMYEEALNIYENLAREDPQAYTPDLAKILYNAGTYFWERGDLSTAEEAYRRAFEKNMQSFSWISAAKAASMISMITCDNKILEESRRIFEMALLFSKEEKYRYAQKIMNEFLYWRLLEENIDTFGALEALRDPELLSLPWDDFLEEDHEKAQQDRELQRKLIKRVLNQRISSFKLPELPEDVLFVYVQKVTDSTLFFVVECDSIEKFTCGNEFLSTGNKLLYNLFIQETCLEKGHDVTALIEKAETLSERWQKTLPPGILDLIEKKDRIIFSLDQYSSLLPLEALYIDGQPLCIGKTVTRAASYHQILTLFRRSPCFDSSLIIGNPWPQCETDELIYSSPQDSNPIRIPYLKGAEEEAKLLGKTLPKPTLLLGENASGDKFLSELSNSSLIHFSGHGLLGRILLLSGYFTEVLLPFEPQEISIFKKLKRVEENITMMQDWYPVTDLELFDIPLIDGAVVFLNACQTGQHRYMGGGYFQGLSAVFLRNGAHSVISSMVPLFDEPSKNFSLCFYETLLTSHSVSESLRRARICTKNKYRAQVYWLPYVHYGAPL